MLIRIPTIRITTQYLAFAGAILSISLASCDTPSSAPSATPNKNASATSNTSTPTPTPEPEPEVTFASIEAGVTAFKEACLAREGEGINQTTRWLAKQGDAAVEPLGQLTNDSSTEVGTRVAAARVLAMINTPAATKQLFMASRAEESLVRTKAAESLGSIRPATTPMLDRLIEMVDDENLQVQTAAISSLQRLGPQAERAVPRLQAMLNSNAPKQLRQQSHKALKEIAPRVGFTQGELDE